jgi:prepilin-type N-terminal cleavage/methylation domain-containing protein
MSKHKPSARNKNFSFTLLELIVSVAILSLGIVFVYEGFFVSLGAYSYSRNYLDGQLWMDEVLWNAQDEISRFNTMFTQASTGTLSIRGKKFLWNISQSLIESNQKANLYAITLRLRWKEGIRNIELTRVAYATYILDEV